MDSIVKIIPDIFERYYQVNGTIASLEAQKTASELLQFVLYRVAQKHPETVREYPQDPTTYRKPMEKAIQSEIETDPEFAKALLVFYNRFTSLEISNNLTSQINSPVAINNSMAAQGNIIFANSSDVQVSGIRAKKIDAKNVVDGIQVSGESSVKPNDLLLLARSLNRGSITAEEIKAENVLSGIQFFAGRQPQTSQDLLYEIQQLRISINGIPNDLKDDVLKEANDAIQVAEVELVSSQPDSDRVVSTLQKVATVLTSGAEVVQAAGNLGSQVFNLAVIASGLWRLAEIIFMR